MRSNTHSSYPSMPFRSFFPVSCPCQALTTEMAAAVSQAETMRDRAVAAAVAATADADAAAANAAQRTVSASAVQVRSAMWWQ
jgi:hypothetical protein